MRRLTTIGILLALSLFVGVGLGGSQEHEGHANVEAAIDALAAAYMEGWNAGDASACAAIYAEDADIVDLFGITFKGRAAIEGSIAETLEAYPGTTIDIVRTSLHQVNDNLVVSDGTWEVMGSTAEGVPTHGFYTIIVTNTGGEWAVTTGQSKVAPEMPTE